MLIFDEELEISRMFLILILNSFYTSYEITIKPINRAIGGTIICRFTSQYYTIDLKIIQNSQVVKKKLNLKSQ